MVPANTVIVFDVQGQTGGFIGVSEADLRAGVLDGLTPFFTVQEASITSGSLLQDVLAFRYHWFYSARVVIKTRVDYNQLDDVRAVIAHAFFEAGGAFPTVTSPSYQESQGAANTETGPSVLDAVKGIAGFSTVLVVGVAIIAAVVWFKK